MTPRMIRKVLLRLIWLQTQQQMLTLIKVCGVIARSSHFRPLMTSQIPQKPVPWNYFDPELPMIREPHFPSLIPMTEQTTTALQDNSSFLNNSPNFNNKISNRLFCKCKIQPCPKAPLQPSKA